MIKKILLPLTIFVLISLTSNNLYARGIATAMGNLKTVGSDGAYDAARNPALLPFLENGSHASAFLSYKTLFKAENDSYIEMDMGSSTFDMHTFDSEISVPESSGYTAHAAYSLSLGGIAFGFAITDGNRDQFQTTKTKYYANMYFNDKIGMNSYSGKLESETTSKEMNPVTIASFGMKTSADTSFGLQIISSYINKNDKTTSNISLAPVSTSEDEKEYSENGYTAELAIGFIKKDNNSHVGFIIKSGEYTYLTKKIKYDAAEYDYMTSTTSYYQDSTSVSNNRYSKGPSISAGGYTKMLDILSIGFEGAFTFSNTYTNKEIDFDKENDKFVITPTTAESKNNFSFSAGLSMAPINELTVALGGGYSLYNIKSNFRQRDEYSGEYTENYGNTNLDFQFLTSGIFYKFADNISLNVIGALIHYINKSEFHSGQGTDSSTTTTTTNTYQYINMQDHLNAYIIDLGIGADYKF